MRHGFFVIMGGFHSADATSGHPLDINELRSSKYIFTMPTTEEIGDKGKSDGLAKAIVIVQTLWFVLQCIARGVRGLPITELEIVTLA